MDGDASPPVAPAPPPSSRLRIAQLAAAAAIAVPGVVSLHAGPRSLHVTAASGEQVDGVVVAASRDGRYDVSLHLVCGLVALPPLAERVRAAVLKVTAAAGLADAVGDVHVRVEELAED